jgi:RNA polymerase sigma-32 factor
MAYMDTQESQRANRRFIKEAMKASLLSREREQELARAWRSGGDRQALHELVSAYMRLVVATAARFRNYGLPMGDLVQEGNVGLMQAAARFDPERDVRFSTYATWWIRASIQDYILRNWSIVRTGTTAAQKALFFNLRRLRARIERGGGEQLSPEGRGKIARALNVAETEVDAMQARLSVSDRSLNAVVGEDGDGEWQDFLADERPNPEEVVTALRDGRTRAKWLNEALSALSQREQTIIRERRLGEEAVTLDALGRRLGISKERVRQIEHQAMRKLRNALEVRGSEGEIGWSLTAA